MLKIVKSFKRYKKAVKYIAENISDENRAEINIVLPGSHIETALLEAASNSCIGFFFFDMQGNPRAMGGVGTDRNIWFVVTGGLSKRELIPWLKKSRELIRTLLEKYSPLWGYWYEKNELSKIWMDWCGFDFAPRDSAANSEINGSRFIYFQKN